MDNSEHESLAGNLLIAIPDLHDPNFFRTVVLLFQHSEEGASGVILNRPSDVTVKQVWNQVASSERCESHELVNFGGPVEGPLMALHTSLAFAETPVVPSVFLTMSSEHLNELVAQNLQQFKLYSGYSGWGAGQLESEIEQGGWLTMPAKATHIFDSPDGLWKQVCDQIGSDILKPHMGFHVPNDPSLN